jgi:type IV pilus assembly protein PilC
MGLSGRLNWLATRRIAFRTGRVAPRQRVQFLRQLALLLGSGVPLLRALEVLGRGPYSEALRTTIAGVVRLVRGGAPLSGALSAFPDCFDPAAIGMMRAGETASRLGPAMERLAELQERLLASRERALSALVYPAIVLAVAMLILGGIVMFIMPRFEEIYAVQLRGQPLPALSQGVLGAGRLLRSPGSAALAAVFGSVLILILARWRYSLQPLLPRLPVIGSLIRSDSIARCSEILGTLLASGVAVTDALQVVEGVSASRRVRESMSIGPVQGARGCRALAGAFGNRPR